MIGVGQARPIRFDARQKNKKSIKSVLQCIRKIDIFRNFFLRIVDFFSSLWKIINLLLAVGAFAILNVHEIELVNKNAGKSQFFEIIHLHSNFR